jgi:hypothetical protein
VVKIFNDVSCFKKWYKKLHILSVCIFTLTLPMATDFPYATSADQTQLALPCHLCMVCTVCYSVSAYFEIFPKMMEWFCKD